MTGQTFVSGACITCSGLMMSNCSTLCLYYYYASASGSTAAACTDCSTQFGTNCIQCTGSVCLGCRYSSNMSLRSDGSGCFNENCTDNNCIECYSSGTKCYKCKSGFSVDSSFACIASTCSITNCMSCDGTLCQQCFPNYLINTAATACLAVCTDPYCKTCLAPGVCGSCTTSSYTVVSGVCTLNCSTIAVANCATCTSYTTCTSCDGNLTLTTEGDFCQTPCSMTNCADCRADAANCTICDTGYDLSTSGDACTQSFCQIIYCRTCSSFSTCSACIFGFSLTSNGTTCTSDCEATHGLTNCLFCSSATTCTVCSNGYVVGTSSGTCGLICSAITNCNACTSATACSSCAAGYSLSTTGDACSQVCVVTGCMTCVNSTVNSCTTCKTGWTTATGTANNTICEADCQEGYVNTVTTGTASCQLCSATVPHCSACSSVSTVINCDTCVIGYFLNGIICENCTSAITNCLECSNSVTCDTCLDGYKLYNGVCSTGACATTVTNCYICSATSNITCVTCDPGYTLVSTACTLTACGDGFVLDETTNSCVCPKGTYNAGGSCTICSDDNCEDCASSSVCTTCTDGRYPLGSTCQKCLDNCQSCNTATSCTECDDGYSTNADGLCVAFGGGTDCATSGQGHIYRCPPGCRICVFMAGQRYKLICLFAKRGFSIVSGSIARCNPLCKTCRSSRVSICSSCFKKYVRRHGTCIRCTDANALTCSRYNPRYSKRCIPGYTAGYNAVSKTGGVCLSCATYCRKCNRGGEGTCDRGGCQKGSVQLTGTTNCTLCFGGCTKCSRNDPNSCLDCGPRRYSDADGACVRCDTGCKTCTSNASNCQSCDRGYWKVSSTCVAIPTNCISLDSTGACTGCFGGYVVNSGATGCDADLTCNNNTPNTCTVCPDGYYLSNVTCLTCGSVANCFACSDTNSSQCTGCMDGYYLDASDTCTACISNCLTCDSDTFCTRAVDGYYIGLDTADAYTGELAACDSTCATCVDQNDFCLSCASGYRLDGSECESTSRLTIVIYFGGSSNSNSIFSNSEGGNNQLFGCLKGINRIGFAIFSILSSRFRRGRSNYRRTIRFRKFFRGSVGINMNVDAAGFSSGPTAASSFTNSVASTPIDGVSYLSSSVVSAGFTASSASSTNLGLVLGLSIPLSILCTFSLI